MYSYEKVDGKVYSDVANLGSFKKLLNKCQEFWLSPQLSSSDQEVFDETCYSFYHDKTYERLKLYYSRFDRSDTLRVLNGIPVQSVRLLASIDWKWLCTGQPGRFHEVSLQNISFLTMRISYLLIGGKILEVTCQSVIYIMI